MKHKSAELLVPPSPHELVVTPTPVSSASTSSSQQRKKPHVLPPLADKRKSSVDWRPRGSPPPSAWRRASIEDNYPASDEDKPAVRVIHCPDVAGPDGAAAVAPAALRATKYAPLEPIKRQPRPV